MSLPLAGLIALFSLSALSPSSAEPPGLSVYEIFLNDRSLGDAVVYSVDDEFWLPESLLAGTGLRLTNVRTLDAAGTTFVSISSISASAAVRVDEAAGAIHVVVGADAFANVSRIGPSAEPAVPIDRATSFFLNYGATSNTSNGQLLATELGGTLGPAFVSTTVSRSARGHVQRSATTVSIDDTARLVRWEVGDTALVSETLGTGARVAGLTVSRQFGIDPHAVQYAPVSMTGTTAAPSTADVYLNDQLVSRTEIPPGTFELHNLPVPAGAGDVRVVLRDSFGRVEELSDGYYRSPSVLKRGLHQFRYTVGSPRIDQSAPFDYRGTALGLQHRTGVTDTITLGGAVTVLPSRSEAGPDVALRLAAGEVELNARASRSDARTGQAAAGTYMFRSRSLTVGLTGRAFSDGFNSTPTLSLLGMPKYDTQASAAVQWSALSVDARVSRGVSWDRRTLNRSTIAASRSLGNRWIASVTASMTSAGNRAERQIAVALTRSIRTRSSVRLQGSRLANGTTEQTLDIQRSLPVGSGLGGYARWRNGSAPESVDLQAQSSMMRAEIRHDTIGATSSQSATVSGSLVFLGGRLFASRPVDDAFGVVKVDQPGVRTYASNQLVGRTNRRGIVFVPSLVSYSDNRVAIDDRDLPLDLEIQEIERLVRPGFRGAAIVAFHGRRGQLVDGRLILDELPGKPAPAHGTASAFWGTDTEISPLGPAGEFFFERATEGVHDLSVHFDGVSYLCRVTIGTKADGRVVHAGEVPCAADRQPAGSR